MSNERMTVVKDEEVKLSFRDEARLIGKQYAIDCLERAKPQIKKLIYDFVDEKFNDFIAYLQHKFAA